MILSSARPFGGESFRKAFRLSFEARFEQLEGKRMASGFIGNEVPRKGLRVRVPCPPP